MSQLFVDNIKNRTGGAVGFPTGVVVTGVATFNNQVSIAGTLSYEDVTNVDSTGIITAKSGINVTAGGINVTAGISTFAGDVSIGDSITHSGDNTAIRFPAADTFTVETAGSEAFRVDSSQRLILGATSAIDGGSTSLIQAASTGGARIILARNDTTTAQNDSLGRIRFYGNDSDGNYDECARLEVIADADHTSTSKASAITVHTTASGAESSTERLRIDSSGRVGINTSSFNDAAEALRVQAVTGQSNTLFTIKANSTTGSSILNFGDDDFNEGRIIYGHSDNSMQFRTDDAERLRITSTGGVHFNNAELIERVSIVANKLSAVPNVSLDNGMVHYYTTNETTTATPNIISTAGINTSMATGDTMSVTIMSKPNNAGYFPKVSIDGVATGITTYWSGGSAPSSAQSSGLDVNVYQIIKTADATYDVLANTSNFA